MVDPGTLRGALSSWGSFWIPTANRRLTISNCRTLERMIHGESASRSCTCKARSKDFRRAIRTRIKISHLETFKERRIENRDKEKQITNVFRER